MNYLVVLSGVPGSGKTYFSNALREDKEKHVYIISSDQIRKEICGNQQDLSQDPLVWKIFYSLIKTYSEDKEGIVILDATNAKKEYRLDLIKPYRKLYDEIDLIDERYFLEVSSVGTQRKLTQEKHFVNSIDKDVHVKLKKICEGKRHLRGNLKAYEDGNIKIQTDDEVYTINLKDCLYVKLEDLKKI